MIKMHFDPKALTGAQKAEWEEWQAEADAAIQSLIDAWEIWLGSPKRNPTATFEFELDNDIWTWLKTWLKRNVFNGKCAYCETPITRFVGDAEHYRPKKRVSVKRNGKMARVSVCVDDSGVEVAHPGYFWLAYDWQNLLPSCEGCNRIEGKGDQFPVGATHSFARKLIPAEVKKLHQTPYESKQRPGWYYLRSEDLNEIEKPMLLHPYFDNPQEHLLFGCCGIVAPLGGSVRGQASIDVFDLEDDNLRRLRQVAQETAENRWLDGYKGQKDLNQCVQEGRRRVETFVKGIEPHSAAACDWLRAKYPRFGP